MQTSKSLATFAGHAGQGAAVRYKDGEETGWRPESYEKSYSYRLDVYTSPRSLARHRWSWFIRFELFKTYGAKNWGSAKQVLSQTGAPKAAEGTWNP